MIKQDEITIIQNKLNKKQRKRVGFKTLLKVTQKSLNRIALRTYIRRIIKLRASENQRPKTFRKDKLSLAILSEFSLLFVALK